MTITKTIFSLLAFALLFAAPQAHAQDARTLERLHDINRINPLQNRAFERSDKVLSRSVQDRKNKIIGNVKDITINANGGIEAITTDFNRLRLGSEIALNYQELRIRGLENSYALNLDAGEVKDIYPQLLANIDTASGNGDTSLSVRRVVGSELWSAKGRRLGRIDQVLFGANGARVDALFVELSYGKNRGKTAAIPFRSASFDEKNGRLRATINNATAEALLKIAE